MKKSNPLLVMILLIASLLGNAQAKKQMQWIGGPTSILQLGSFKILTDPMLGGKSKESFRIKVHPNTGELNAAIERYTDPAEFDNSNFDLLLISHPHPDHIDEKAINTLDKNIQTITTMSSLEQIKTWGFKNSKGLEWNDNLILKKGKETLTINAVQAMHADSEPLNTSLGKVNGYVIEYASGKSIYRIYWSGDTVWFDKINDLKKFGKLDLFIPDMGAVGYGKRGLSAAACLKIIEALDPKRIIPVHHTTFSHYTEPISVLEDLISKTKYKKRLSVIDLGVMTKL